MNDSETPWTDAEIIGSMTRDSTDESMRSVSADFARRLERLVRVQHEALRVLMTPHEYRAPGADAAEVARKALEAHASLRAELESR